MTKNQQAKKLKLLKLLEDNPLVTMACNRAGISRATYYRWRDEDQVFSLQSTKAIERGVNKINDFAESKLIENIKANNQQAIAYWLRSNHRSYRPQALRLVIEDNKKKQFEIVHLQALLDELIRKVGVEKLIDTAVPDPDDFKRRLRSNIDESRKRTDEL